MADNFSQEELRRVLARAKAYASARHSTSTSTPSTPQRTNRFPTTAQPAHSEPSTPATRRFETERPFPPESPSGTFVTAISPPLEQYGEIDLCAEVVGVQHLKASSSDKTRGYSTAFIIEVSLSTRRATAQRWIYTVPRRYSEFDTCHQELIAAFPKAKLAPLPPKNPFATQDRIFLERRREELANWLASAMSAPGLRKSQPIANLLDLGTAGQLVASIDHHWSTVTAETSKVQQRSQRIIKRCEQTIHAAIDIPLRKRGRALRQCAFLEWRWHVRRCRRAERIIKRRTGAMNKALLSYFVSLWRHPDRTLAGLRPVSLPEESERAAASTVVEGVQFDSLRRRLEALKHASPSKAKVAALSSTETSEVSRRLTSAEAAALTAQRELVVERQRGRHMATELQQAYERLGALQSQQVPTQTSTHTTEQHANPKIDEAASRNMVMFQKLLARVEALIEESMRSRKGLDWGTWKSQICSMMVTESEQAIREMMEEIEFLMAHNSQLGATADEAVHAHNAHAVAMG